MSEGDRRVVMQAFVLASPYYMQVANDSGLPALGLLTVLAPGYGIAVNVARWLFRLQVSWFEMRHVGDVRPRFQSITPSTSS